VFAKSHEQTSTIYSTIFIHICYLLLFLVTASYSFQEKKKEISGKKWLHK